MRGGILNLTMHWRSKVSKLVNNEKLHIVITDLLRVTHYLRQLHANSIGADKAVLSPSRYNEKLMIVRWTMIICGLFIYVEYILHWNLNDIHLLKLSSQISRKHV